MFETRSYSFEVGRRAKPDELDANIADLIGAYLLEQDPTARFDLRVAGSFRGSIPHVELGGEVSENMLTQQHQDAICKLVVGHYRAVHRDPSAELDVFCNFRRQSAHLAVNGERKKAGDSGAPIAVAYEKGPHFLPWERFLAVRIRDTIDNIYQNDGRIPDYLDCKATSLRGLAADGKVSVRVHYDEYLRPSIGNVVIAAQQETGLSLAELKGNLIDIVTAELRYIEKRYGTCLVSDPFSIYVNRAGNWHDGGWRIDAGNREAKPQRQFFGAYGLNEDAGQGEDRTKPSATGTFLARYLAVQLVAHGFTPFARVELEYVIGEDQPILLEVTTDGHGREDQKSMQEWLSGHVARDLSLAAAIEQFNLRSPDLYKTFVRDSDMFQNLEFPWNHAKINYINDAFNGGIQHE